MKNIPVVENIHQKVYEAASRDGALDMGYWHRSEAVDETGAYCGTTHCRAGWVVTLAGKAGKDLEEATGPVFAAMQIYKASSTIPVSPTRFFETDGVAIEDIKRCAELELNSQCNV